MKNNEPQNLFFLKGINCVKILLFSLLILFLQKSYAERTLSVRISINTSGLIVLSSFLFGRNLYMPKHNPLNVHVRNSTNQIFYYGF
jgi:hypothetical protein